MTDEEIIGLYRSGQEERAFKERTSRAVFAASSNILLFSCITFL